MFWLVSCVMTEAVAPDRHSTIKRLLCWGCLFLALFLLPQSVLAQSQEPAQVQSAYDVKIYTEDFPPFNYVTPDGLRGAGGEMVRAMSVLVGYEAGFEVLPWKRALQIVKTKPGTALFSMARTPEREDEFKWVGPIFVTRGWLYKKADRKFDITKLSDAKSVHAVGVQAGGAAERSLRKLGFENLEPLYVPETSLRMLVEDRIDLWVASDIVMNFQRKKLGLDQGEVVPAIRLGKYEMYLAFSKDTPEQVIEPWRKALDIVRDMGVADVISRKYGLDEMTTLITDRVGVSD